MDREPNSFPSAKRERDSAKHQETPRERDSAKHQETPRERDSAKHQETPRERDSAKHQETPRERDSAKHQVRGMHHHAFRSCDIEKTRKFYEEVIGLPLIATFVEMDNPLYKDGPSYIHVFFELGDGSC